MAELLPSVNIGDVNLYDGALQTTYAVLQGNTGVSVGTGIEHDAVTDEAYFLHFVNQFSLDVALVVTDFHFRITCLQLRQVLVERGSTINAGLTGTQ